jgi:predicted AlkP superfamily pyrophosphatase or phosphodiesterase
MQRMIVLAAALAFAGAGGAVLGKGKAPRPEPPGNVVLVGWDGAGRSNVREYMARNELPALARIASAGSIVAIDILRTTDTKAGWTQILTGYEPERTGVFNNWRYHPIPKGYTVFERLEQSYGPDEFVTVAVIGKSNNLDCGAPTKTLLKGDPGPKKVKDQNENIEVVEEGGKRFEVAPGKPYYHTAKSMDVFENGLMKDKKVGERAIELLEKYADRPFFFFVHFAEIDHTGHHHGEGSKQQHDAYVSADRWTGKILDKLEELGIDGRTTVYVTSDHGFDLGQKLHKDAPYVFLATNDKAVMRRGERADIAPTMLEKMGLDPTSFDPPIDGHTLTGPHEQPIW